MAKGFKEMVAEANALVEVIDLAEAKTRHDAGEALFVDVRETVERDKGTIPHSLHLPRGSLEFIADPTSAIFPEALSSGRPLVLFCAAGGRSALAARTLQEMGYANVAHVAGGFTAWNDAGLPVQHRDVTGPEGGHRSTE